MVKQQKKDDLLLWLPMEMFQDKYFEDEMEIPTAEEGATEMTQMIC